MINIWLVILSTIVGTSTSVVPTSIPVQNANNSEMLAQCLSSKNAKLYGAYWCPHCSDQKKLFGTDLNYIDYVECDSKGPNGDPEACIKAGIESYPTWQMPGKETLIGTQTLKQLAEWSGC